MDFKDIENKEICINCQTLCEAEQFVELALGEGYRWGHSESLTNAYLKSKQTICFYIVNKFIYHCKYVAHPHFHFKTIKFTDFIKEDFETMNEHWISTVTAENEWEGLVRRVKEQLTAPPLFNVTTYETRELEMIRKVLCNKPTINLPQITKIEVKNDTVVIMTFADGTTEKAVTSPEDTFSLEQGISICITKKLLSMQSYGNGSSLYNKLVHKALKLYNDEQAEAAQKEELKQIEIDRSERLAAKRAKRKAKYEAKKREREISIQAEAYARALRMVNQGENK